MPKPDGSPRRRARSMRARLLPSSLLTLAACAALALGCNQQQPALTASSGDQASYAERYPYKLEAVRARYADGEKEARENLPELRKLPDSLKDPDYTHVLAVVELADQDGRSASYAERALETEAVARFHEEEKEPLRQKVAGGVNYAAKQKNCNEELGGAAVASMERGVEKQLEERTRASSEAQRYIEDHEDELGKANVDALEKHAERLARTSHLVHVRLELYRRELETLLGDASAAESTLDRVLRESDAVLTDDKASKSKKAVAERRKEAAQQARNRIQIDVEQAQRALGEMDQRIAQLKADYQSTLDALRADLEKRAEDKP